MRRIALESSLVVSCAAAVLAVVVPSRAVAQSSPQVVLLASNSGGKVLRATDYMLILGGIVSPRDPASGQATGKRQHVPLAALSTERSYDLGPLSSFASVPPTTSDVPLKFVIDLNGAQAGLCIVTVGATLRPRATRVEVRLGDAARYFDEDGVPKGGVCQRQAPMPAAPKM